MANKREELAARREKREERLYRERWNQYANENGDDDGGDNREDHSDLTTKLEFLKD